MAFLGALGPVLGAIGTGVSAFGTIASGVAASRQAEQEALNAEAKGKEEFAAATREAADRRKEAAQVLSRQQAAAAASGGGAGSDAPTILRIMGETAGQGELNAQQDIWGGLSRREGMNMTARMRRAEGRASLLGGVLGGFGQMASGFGQLGRK